MILYIVYPKESTSKLLELKHVLAKFQDTKLTYKSNSFSVYHEQTYQKNKSGSHSIHNSLKIHCGRNLIKDANEFYNEKVKTLKKEINDEAKDGKIYGSRLEDLIF